MHDVGAALVRSRDLIEEGTNNDESFCSLYLVPLIPSVHRHRPDILAVDGELRGYLKF